jgi:arsenate reductase
LLEEHGVAYRYREYTQEPLSKAEIKKVLKMLGLGPRDVLRKNDNAYKELGLDGSETDAKLIAHMAEHPTLLQRPIGVSKTKAVLGRPIDNLLELV